MLDESVAREIKRRLDVGCEQIDFAELERRLDVLGYKLDRTMDCRSIARDMTSGESYACVSGYPREKDTKRSFCNIEARRDNNFSKLQTLRANVFTLLRGAIYDA